MPAPAAFVHGRPVFACGVCTGCVVGFAIDVVAGAAGLGVGLGRVACAGCATVRRFGAVRCTRALWTFGAARCFGVTAIRGAAG